LPVRGRNGSQLTAVGESNLARDCQTEARALGLGGEEWLEQVFERFLVETRP
jgi:hypothetical protein